ncbi:MAG: sulfatase [Planctomycetaceae bacterium]|nr:sulfatase [Planctomycetaceae bacterium]
MNAILHFAILTLVSIPLSVQTFAVQPNVVVILVDDQGYYDLGCYGATEVRTPQIDAMAEEGVRLTDYYAAAPICSPSRAGLLTGCYPRRVGLATWVQRADSQRGIHPDELTIAELFQQQGYRTACIGKWHLGAAEPFLPQNQGFDEYFGLLHNLDPVETVYFDDRGGVPLLRGRNVVKRPVDPAELTRLYTDEAIAFMAKNREQSFFLYLPHTMLHVPLGVSSEFQGTSELGEYGDAIHELDHHVGRLMKSIRSIAAERPTVVVYASDNGRGPGRNQQQPLKGQKLTTWEAGIRVPCLIWGPQAGIRAGHVSDAIVHAMDWYATLASLAEIALPPDQVIDGRDLSALLRGDVDEIPDPDQAMTLNAAISLRRPWNPGLEWRELISRSEYTNAFFYHGSEGQLAAVRSGRWKLLLSPAPTLYDLHNDPGETTPVRNGPVIRKLRGMAILFQEELRDAQRPVGRAD